MATQAGHVEMSSLLIEHGADINYQSKNGLAAIHLAAQDDRLSIAKLLVNNHADVNVNTKVTEKAFQYEYVDCSSMPIIASILQKTLSTLRRAGFVMNL